MYKQRPMHGAGKGTHEAIDLLARPCSALLPSLFALAPRSQTKTPH